MNFLMLQRSLIKGTAIAYDGKSNSNRSNPKMWFRKQPSRLDRIEESIERLAEINTATNRRIDRFVEATNQRVEIVEQQLQVDRERIEQLQEFNEQLRRAVEYLLSKDR